MLTKTPTPKQIANDPRLFAQTFLKVLNKDKKLVPLRWNKMQEHFHANRTGRDLILKSRQLGASTYVQAELYRRAVTSTRTTISLAHDTDTTQKLRAMADRFWKNCKFGDVQPLRHYANASVTTYPEFDSEVTIGTAGSTAKGRGGTFSDLHGSEVAFWPDAEGILAGAMQGGNPDVVLESTPNGAQGAFYEMCMEALGGNSIWTLHFYPWWWDENYRIISETGSAQKFSDFVFTDEERELSVKHSLDASQIKWRRNKQRELGRLFSQEYPEDPVTCFLTSGNSYFGDLSGVFTAPPGLDYIEGHTYISGLDFGQTNDFTAMPVFDMNTKCQVDLLHINKLPWKEMRARIKQMYIKWHLESLPAEKNSIGQPNIEALQDDEVNAVAFETTNESKAGIMSGMNEKLHHGGWKLLDIPIQKHEFNTFVATQLPSGAWKYAADGDGHDDIVMADGIALGAPPIQVFV